MSRTRVLSSEILCISSDTAPVASLATPTPTLPHWVAPIRVQEDTGEALAIGLAPVGKPFSTRSIMSLLERSRAIFALALKQKSHAREVTQIRCERGATLARLMRLSEATADGICNLDEHWDDSGNPDGIHA